MTTPARGRRPVVLYDGHCGFCEWTKGMVTRVDWLRAIEWVPLQSEAAQQFGIPRERLEGRMHVVGVRHVWSGWRAWKQILLRLPLTWIVMVATTAMTPWFGLWWLLFWSPLVNPIGEAGYDWVARNRHRLPGSTCSL